MNAKKQFLLSHSKRMTWQQCHLKYKYNAIQRLFPRIGPEPLVMGSVGHSAWDVNKVHGQEIATKYIQRCGQIEMIKTLDFYNQTEVALPLQMRLKEYRTAFKIKFFEDDEYEVFYTGELDGIAEITRPVLVGDWVLERKFTRQVPTNITKRFLLDDQGQGYLWAEIQRRQMKGIKELPQGVLVEVIRNTNNPTVVREIFPLSSMPHGDDWITFCVNFENEIVSVYQEIREAERANRYVESKHSCHAMGECWYYKLCAEPATQAHPEVHGYMIMEQSHEEDVALKALPGGPTGG